MRLLTAIPKIKRSYWQTKIEDFYITYFRNLIPKSVRYQKLKRIKIFFKFRANGLSKADNDFTDESRLSKQSKRKRRDKHKQLMEKLIVFVGNQSIGTIENPNFEKHDDAKEVIISIRNELEFHRKQAIKYAILAGQSLIKIQELCQIGNSFSIS